MRDKNESLKISDFELIQISNHESDLKSVKKKKKEERESVAPESLLASNFTGRLD